MTVSVREAYTIWKRDFRRGRLLGDYGDFNARFREMAYSTGLMALPAGWTLPRWSMFGGRVGSVLGSRGGVGGVLGSGRGGASTLPAWAIAGGVSPANVIACYQPKGAASLEASYINLANPGTYTAAPGVAPTWAAATGWKFNASTQYLTTGVVPASNQTWSVLVRFSGGDGFSCALLGCGTPYFFLWDTANVGGLGVWYGSGGGLLFVTPNLNSGVLGFAGNVGYRNGAAESGTMTAPSGTATRDIWIGGWNNGSGSPVNASNRYIQAVAIYNTVLSSTQVGLISTAMAAL